MLARDYFPLGKAYGEAFCNRVNETKELAGNILAGKHTFLVAPRRYGKSSLAEKAIAQAKLPWAKVDFHLAIKEKDAERLILAGVIDLIGRSISSIDKMTAQIKKFVKNLKPKFDLGNDNFRLELEINSGSLASENIAESLNLLEKLLREKNKRAVLLFDEFQELGGMSDGHGIEGAIRSIAQETSHLAIVFSGSNPHLLKNMFENDRRPLYKLCRRMVVQRISKEHYQEHLNKASKLEWKQPLNEIVFNEIMQLSDRHPYYVNLLCDQLWSQLEMPKSKNAVIKAWDYLIEGERSDLIKDFLQLSENQKIVLMYLANGSGVNLLSGEVLEKMGLPLSSAKSAIYALEEKDFIERRDGEYVIIAPVYKSVLKN